MAPDNGSFPTACLCALLNRRLLERYLVLVIVLRFKSARDNTGNSLILLSGLVGLDSKVHAPDSKVHTLAVGRRLHRAACQRARLGPGPEDRVATFDQDGTLW